MGNRTVTKASICKQSGRVPYVFPQRTIKHPQIDIWPTNECEPNDWWLFAIELIQNEVSPTYLTRGQPVISILKFIWYRACGISRMRIAIRIWLIAWKMYVQLDYFDWVRRRGFIKDWSFPKIIMDCGQTPAEKDFRYWNVEGILLSRINRLTQEHNIAWIFSNVMRNDIHIKQNSL